MSAAYAVMQCMSVWVSVTSRCIFELLYHLVAPPFYVFRTKHFDNIQTGPPLPLTRRV